MPLLAFIVHRSGYQIFAAGTDLQTHPEALCSIMDAQVKRIRAKHEPGDEARTQQTQQQQRDGQNQEREQEITSPAVVMITLA